MLLNIMH